MTWAKLPAIQANCGIEMTLDKCMLELSEVMAMKKQVAGLYRMARPHGHRAAPGKLPRQRIPSWINLSAMGEGCFPPGAVSNLVPATWLAHSLFSSSLLTLLQGALRGPVRCDPPPPDLRGSSIG